MARPWFLLPLFALVLAPVAGAQAVAGPDLSTPRRALRHFIDAARAGDHGTAAKVLDLSSLPRADRADAPRLARQLKFVLDRTLWIEWERISDAPEGDPADGADVEILGTVTLGSETVPIRMVRSATGWRLGPATVARTPLLFADHGPGPIGERMPDALVDARFLEVAAWQWIGLALAAIAAWLVSLFLAWVGLALADRIARRTSATWDDRLVAAFRGPARFFFAVAAIGPLVALLRLSVPAQNTVDHLRETLLVVSVAWLAMRLVAFVADTAQSVLTAGATDEGKVRGVRTQVAVLRRIASVLVGTVAAALVLTQFEVVRNVGMSLLASAGLAGIVVGLAAQKSISSLLAGIQLSITQPVRIGDTVIVEGEWGSIEEIHLTYVVVKVWDQRRLIVPITRFLDQPFENWTKRSPEILGTVEIPADFTVPVDRLREELKRICEGHPCWDGRVCKVQVTAADDRRMIARALVSSADASKNWDLRCDVREGLIRYLRELEGGRYLPRARVEAPDGVATAVNTAVVASRR